MTNEDIDQPVQQCGACLGERVAWVKDDEAQPGEPQHFSIDCPTCHGLGLVAKPVLMPEVIERPKHDRSEPRESGGWQRGL